MKWLLLAAAVIAVVACGPHPAKDSKEGVRLRDWRDNRKLPPTRRVSWSDEMSSPEDPTDIDEPFEDLSDSDEIVGKAWTKCLLEGLEAAATCLLASPAENGANDEDGDWSYQSEDYLGGYLDNYDEDLPDYWRQEVDQSEEVGLEIKCLVKVVTDFVSCMQGKETDTSDYFDETSDYYEHLFLRALSRGRH